MKSPSESGRDAPAGLRETASLIVFAKEPIAGKVKTRLTPPLEPADAVLLYTAFVEDTCATVAAASAKGDRRVLAFAGDSGPVLAAIAKRLDFELVAQEGADLGVRMAHAIRGELERGSRAVVLVGSDSPTFPRAEIEAAVQRLCAQSPRAVLGPAWDGGYWIVGASGSVPDLFDGIPWSTGGVLAATVARARERQIDLWTLCHWNDVDEIADLRHLDEQLRSIGAERAPRTAAALAELRARHPGFFSGGTGT